MSFVKVLYESPALVRYLGCGLDDIYTGQERPESDRSVLCEKNERKFAIVAMVPIHKNWDVLLSKYVQMQNCEYTLLRLIIVMCSRQQQTDVLSV